MSTVIKIPKTVAFTGHREYENQEWVDECLATIIERANTNGYKRYISGMAKGIDTLGAELVGENKEHYLILAYPFDIPDNAPKKILERADEIRVISPGGYRKDKYWIRDKWMVDNATSIISVLDNRNKGGTYITTEYALKLDKPVFRINPSDKTAQWIFYF